MNVSVNTVLVAFELSLSAFSQHTLSHLISKSGTDIFVENGAVVSDIQNNETASSGIRIDLEKLAGIDGNDGALWNVELKRSRSLEPIFCTFRLPPLILGGKFLFSNVVASIRPSGVVHVLGSGSVEGILGISMKIQELLSTLLRRDAINEALVLRPVTATESSEKCGKKRERAKVEEEECLWQVATEFCRKLEDPDAVLPAKEKKKIHNERHTGGQDVGRTPPPLFTLPSVLFARAAIYPSRRELRRLRLVALQERTEHTLLENSNEETANLTALHEKSSSEPGGTDEFKHFSSTPEEIVAEDQKHSIHPSLKVNRRIISPLPYRECRTSFVRRKGKPYGLFFFNATGEEAVRWISCFLGEGKDGRSIQEEEAFLLSTCPPNRVHRSVIRRKLRFVRHHILHGNVKRLSKRKGIQIQVLCRNTFGASKGVLPAVREDLCSTSLAFDNTTMESDGSSLCTTSQGVHSPSNFMLDSVAVDYSSVSYDDRDARPKYLQMNEEDNGGIVIGYHSYMWRSVGLWKTLRSTFIEEETKMVLVVRKDLKMGSGKVAAQCAHAAVANVEMLYSLGRICDESGHGTATLSGSSTRPSVWHDWFCAWRVSGYAKVVVQCADENELLEIARKSKEAAVPYYVVRDAGRTQVLAGSKTVVAVGPAPKSLVDTVTGHLKLY